MYHNNSILFLWAYFMILCCLVDVECIIARVMMVTLFSNYALWCVPISFYSPCMLLVNATKELQSDVRDEQTPACSQHTRWYFLQTFMLTFVGKKKKIKPHIGCSISWQTLHSACRNQKQLAVNLSFDSKWVLLDPSHWVTLEQLTRKPGQTELRELPRSPLPAVSSDSLQTSEN